MLCRSLQANLKPVASAAVTTASIPRLARRSVRSLSVLPASSTFKETTLETGFCSGEQHNQGDDQSKEQKSWWQSFNKLIWTVGGATLPAAGIITFRSSFGQNNNGPPFDRFPVIEDLHQAVLEGDERKVKALMKQCEPADLNIRHKLGWQLLHVAAVNGRSSICELLVQGGAMVNDIDHYSSPRLMSEKLNLDPLVVALIRSTEFNQDLASINFHGCTPLHYAVISNSFETVQVLVKNGANPSIKNDLGFKPSNFSTSSGLTKFLNDYEQQYERRERELEEEERRRYPLEKRIKERIVGQEAAIQMVAATIRRKQNGWFDDDHPLVFLFLGSSGIGKTELAKQVAKYLHKDNKEAFIRLDMSEYQEQHSVARMIGSPPGYIGHDNGGQLTDALKKCKNAVVLFDEVEKAHPKVLTVLLQLFDEGRLTDGKGNTIECKDAIFIMTSNLASEAIAEHAMQLRLEQQVVRDIKKENRLRGLLSSSNQNNDDESGKSGHGNSNDQDENYQEQITISRKFKDTIVRPVLKAHFQRDEFLGRINEMVYFLPFSDTELRQLVQKELEFWASRAETRNNIEMTWDDRVIDVICKGYDIHYGARSIKHEVERRIINQISELHYTVKKGKKVHISVSDHAQGANLISIKIS